MLPLVTFVKCGSCIIYTSRHGCCTFTATHAHSTMHSMYSTMIHIVHCAQAVIIHHITINGMAAIMLTLSFLFGLTLAELILQYTDNLSRTLQATSLSAVVDRFCR